jgi:hypothetical protein
LLIETILIVKFGKVKKQIKAFGIVTLANLISFLAPYVERAYRFIPTSGGDRCYQKWYYGAWRKNRDRQGCGERG